MLLDKTALVYKPNNSGGISLYTPLPSIQLNIQPASPELTAMSEGEMFKTYKAFTRASGVLEGMRLTVSGTTDIYVVRGREKFDYGVEQHYELVLAKGER